MSSRKYRYAQQSDLESAENPKAEPQGTSSPSPAKSPMKLIFLFWGLPLLLILVLAFLEPCGR